MRLLSVMVFLCGLCRVGHAQTIPPAFDLRNVNGTNYSTSVKSQTGGTCWTHGTMAAIESNLRKTGVWTQEGESDEPNLAEYHLDWWNGFNQHNNDDRDPPAGGGLEVHMGGDYRVASAYCSRGEGAVRDIDGQSYAAPPARHSDTYHYYYPRHIEWFIDDLAEGSRDAIKRTIMNHGAIGTCMYWGGGFFSSATRAHYQPPSDANDPNHAIAIIGWDDTKATPCATDGAWLCKNSWGVSWYGDGLFWISYYDKHACKEPQMGAVSFRDVVRQPYLNFYYHDYHGWRDTMPTNTALAVYTARTNEDLVAVSFFTAADEVDYEVRIYRQFASGTPGDLACSATGRFERTGFHTVDLDAKVPLTNGQPFHIYLALSHGGQPYDRTSDVPVLLGKPVAPEDAQAFSEYLESMGKMGPLAVAGTEVVSAANGGENYYLAGTVWVDLTNVNTSANFCLKGLTVQADLDDDGIPDDLDPDDDNDDMPDWWEAQREFDARDPADGILDPDNDGALNWQEYVADTDPTNVESYFRIVALSNLPPWTITFAGASTQRLYTLNWTTNLADAAWTNDPSQTRVWGHGATDVMAVPDAGPGTQFYRLGVELP